MKKGGKIRIGFVLAATPVFFVLYLLWGKSWGFYLGGLPAMLLVLLDMACPPLIYKLTHPAAKTDSAEPSALYLSVQLLLWKIVPALTLILWLAGLLYR